MNKFTGFCVVIGAILLSGCTHIEAGHVGVQINNCGGGGVDQQPVGIGYHVTGMCTTIVEYPTYVQTAVWTRDKSEGHPANEEITFTNADQLTIAVDISVAYQLDPNKVPAFYAKFRDDELDGFTHGFLRNLAREKFDNSGGKYHIEQIMGDNAAFLHEVRDALQADLKPYGVQLSQFGFIGAPRPPAGVIEAINMKIQATQKAFQVENELRQAEAEARKAVATAKGEADAQKAIADAESYANKKLTESLSPTLVEYLKVRKWDGKLPTYQGSGTQLITMGGGK